MPPPTPSQLPAYNLNERNQANLQNSQQQGVTGSLTPPSLFKEPLAPEFDRTPTLGINQAGGLPQADQTPYGGMSPGDALGGGLTMKQPGQAQPQLSQLLSIMPPDFAAQITPEQMAAFTPEQISQMIVKFSQPAAPQYVGHGDELINPRTPVITESVMGKGQVYGLGRSNPLSM
jgi:hypothetical protein